MSAKTGRYLAVILAIGCIPDARAAIACWYNSQQQFVDSDTAPEHAVLRRPQWVAEGGAHEWMLALDVQDGTFCPRPSMPAVQVVSSDGIVRTILKSPDVKQPYGIAMDSLGALYVTSRSDSRIVKLTREGVITTVAGTGQGGFSGDGGQARNAQLNEPAGIAVDSQNRIVFADTFNRRVRRIDVDGTITTIAGSGRRGNEGDGGPALQANFVEPTGVAVDGAGNVYVTDSYSGKVRKIDPAGNIVRFAGGVEIKAGPPENGKPALSIGLNAPSGIAAIGADIYLSTSQGALYRIGADGIAHLINAAVDFGQPLGAMGGLAVDSAGFVYVSDSMYAAVTRVDRDGRRLKYCGVNMRRVDGDGMPCQLTALWAPTGVLLDASDNLYIVDSGTGTVKEVQ